MEKPPTAITAEDREVVQSIFGQLHQSMIKSAMQRGGTCIKQKEIKIHHRIMQTVLSEVSLTLVCFFLFSFLQYQFIQWHFNLSESKKQWIVVWKRNNFSHHRLCQCSFSCWRKTSQECSFWWSCNHCLQGFHFVCFLFSFHNFTSLNFISSYLISFHLITSFHVDHFWIEFLIDHSQFHSQNSNSMSNVLTNVDISEISLQRWVLLVLVSLVCLKKVNSLNCSLSWLTLWSLGLVWIFHSAPFWFLFPR